NKNCTRIEYQNADTKNSDYNNFLIEKAKKFVKKHHINSEVHDRLHGKTTHIHHIFPKNEFPEISDYIENLIALTAGQHYELAHPQGNTHIIDKMYQCVCLESKLNSIKNSKILFYRKENFITVLNIGFKYDNDNKIINTATFDELKKEIARYYKTV
ncbi:MAG: hypothetical protein LUB59_05570, partial [Candidatus Gastranaerophilales bacterium]|nr:hypothetical protein [Candidatus Gastranaerophilales bacterium]